MWRNPKYRRSIDLNAKEMSEVIAAAQLDEQEIRRLHADFLDKNPSGLLDKNAFIEYFQKLQPNSDLTEQLKQYFDIVDANNDNMIDFNELLVMIAVTSRLNNVDSRLALLFDSWDQTNDGQIDQKELTLVISAIYDYTGQTDRKGERDPKKRAQEIIKKLDIDGDKKLSKQEFIAGCKNDSFILNLLAPNI